VIHEPLKDDGERAIASVLEAEYPLCKVELRVHDGRASCLCCGDIYRAATDRLEIKPCVENSRRGEHWEPI